MADVFISYARADEPVARRIADALGAAGFDVWWDTKLLPHNAFAQSIETELRAAKAVLVIWSNAAIGSQWVRAEAEAGRALGTLLQVRADDCVIPLPFNQFQTARLQRWDGDPGDLEWRAVLASVEWLAGRESVATTQSTGGSKRPVAKASKRVLWASLAAGVVALLLGLWLTRSAWLPAPAAPKLAVQPFAAIGGGSAVRDFAAGLTDSLEGALSVAKLPMVSHADAESLRGDDVDRKLQALGVGFLLNGSVEAQGEDLTVRVHLDNPQDHATLWTAELSAPSTQTRPLQAQVAARTIAVLGCAAQALRPKVGLSDAAQLALYFRACDLAETSGHGGEDAQAAYAMFDAFRKVAAQAPEFADAHAQLAKHLAFVLPDLPSDQAPAARAEADREAHRALQLDPRSADAYVALGLLAPQRQFTARERLFGKALAIDPDWPHANGFLANVLVEVGRLGDAAVHYERAAAVNPLSLDWSEMAASGLSRTGRTDQAEAEFARLAELWPKDPWVWGLRLENLVAARRWDEALAQLKQAGDHPGLISPATVSLARATYSALRSGDKAQLAAARDLYLKAGDDPASLPAAISGLSLLGFVDDAFALAGRYGRSPQIQNDSSEFLFGPKLAAMRRDPRFIPFATRFGLVDYWRKTGKWPDFCSQPGLPYDCRVEAARSTVRGN
jgi:tetratricopeptide (TPR) repeat protein